MLRTFIFTLTDALTVHYTDWIDLLKIEPVVVIWGRTTAVVRIPDEPDVYYSI